MLLGILSFQTKDKHQKNFFSFFHFFEVKTYGGCLRLEFKVMQRYSCLQIRKARKTCVRMMEEKGPPVALGFVFLETARLGRFFIYFIDCIKF